MNERIRVREVRLVGSGGEQLGIKSAPEAIALARAQGLDLVEVAAQANPPVCKIMDWGKHRYEQSQREKESRRRQSQIIVKEMKFRPKIDVHDYETKKKHVIRFLEDGSKVKITIMFRGREMTHTELGKKILDQLAEDLADLAGVESLPKLDGRNMIMILNPIKHEAKVPDKSEQTKVHRPKGKGRRRREQEGAQAELAEEAAEPEPVAEPERAEEAEEPEPELAEEPVPEPESERAEEAAEPEPVAAAPEPEPAEEPEPELAEEPKPEPEPVAEEPKPEPEPEPELAEEPEPELAEEPKPEPELAEEPEPELAEEAPEPEPVAAEEAAEPEPEPELAEEPKPEPEQPAEAAGA